ncbi:hypothetical protein LOTGIDRAFT_132948, partial [Lottia gigantea]
PVFFVVAPNVLKVNVEELITVTTFGDVEQLEMQIYLQDFPEQKHNFSHRQITVRNDEITNVTVKLSVEDAMSLEATAHYIYLVAESSSPNTPFKQTTKLLLDYHPGYIFIQSDKPIYTPGQKVNVRVIALDENTRPVDWPVQVDIVNPDEVTVSRSKKEGTVAFHLEELEIPDYPVFGNYTVTASFANGVKTSSSIRFEVREYVLPHFTVLFDVEDEYQVILPDHKEIKANLNARYVFGKPVRGHITISYGLVWHGHTFILGRQRNIQVNRLVIYITIKIEDIRVASQSMWFPNGGRLFLEAAVTEEASGRVEHAVDQSIVFAKSPYILKFTRCSRYFKPGLPYVIHVDAIRSNGQPARHLPVIIEGKGEVKEETVIITPLMADDEKLETDADGRLATELLLPAGIKTLAIIIRTKIPDLPEVNQTESYFAAVPYYSPSDTYMSVRALPTVMVSIIIIIIIIIRDSHNMFILQVIAKGRIVHHTRTRALAGQRTNFYIPVTSDMSPSARILTFSLRGTGSGCEVVADATWLDIEEQCANEVRGILKTDNDGFLYKPGDEMTITVEAKPDTTVGLLAVDKSVYILKNKRLSREKLFTSIREHDRGCGYGGGSNSAYVFQGAGLSIITNADMKTETRSSEGCPDKAVRRRRSTGFEEINPDLNRCFNAAKFVYESTNSTVCADEFYKCCKYKTQGDDAGEGTADDDAVNLIFNEEEFLIDDIPLRSNFPESWLFEDFYLREEGTKEISVTLPDSITTWMVQGITLSKQHGFCVSKPHNITVFSNFFVFLDLPYSAVRLEQLEVRVTIYNYMSRDLSARLFMQSVEGVCYSGEPGENSEMAHVDIPPNDAASVSFPIIPLELGLFPIRVYAYSTWGNDAVEKILYVEVSNIIVILQIRFTIIGVKIIRKLGPLTTFITSNRSFHNTIFSSLITNNLFADH